MADLRRTFLTQIAGGALVPGTAVTRAAPPKTPLPTVPFGRATITRLIMGGNPLGGYSHSTRKLDDIMRHYFTVQRTADLLIHAEEQGITTFQSHYSSLVRDGINQAREQGSKMQWICLTHPGEDNLWNEIAALKPIGVAHHGNRTDDAFHYNQNPEKIRDFVKKVKDAGMFAGISTHSPHVFARIEDSGWENDFYMGCLYYLTRTPDELKGIYNDRLVTKEEPFVAGDPARMCQQIRNTKKPCLAFKLLGAGRNCWTKELIEGSFQFAYANIKKADACIVGMFPILSDEVRENADYARKYAKT